MEMTAKNILKLSDGTSEFEAEGKRVFFSPYRLFNLIDRETEAFSRLCEELAGFLRSQERLYVYARTTFFRDLQQDSPALASLDLEFIDESGLAALAEAFPEREVIPIDCRSVIRQHGSLHCLTMQLPRGSLADTGLSPNDEER